MDPRVYGLETEYILAFRPRERGGPAPQREAVFRELAGAVALRSGSVPARGRKNGLFLQNGSFLQYEAQLPQIREGIVEWATPECLSPREVVAYSRAQDEALLAAIPEAEKRLREQGWAGEILLGKANLGSEGRSVGAHENYWVEDRAGPVRATLRALLFPPFFAMLQLFRLGLYALVAGAVAALLLGAVGAAALAGLARVPGLGRPLRPFAARSAAWTRRLESRLEGTLLRLLGWLFYRVYRPLVRIYSAYVNLAAFATIRRGLVGHLATRVVYAGAGRVALDSPGAPAAFQLSQRADVLAAVSRIYWDEPGRPFLDTKVFFFEPFALFRRRKRLHLLAGDSNLCETAESLKFGATGLVLRLIEEGRMPDPPVLADPVGAIRAISRDPTLRVRVELRGGARLTALEIQRIYLERAATAFGGEGGGTAETLRLWRQVLDRLERDPGETRGQVDWVAKRELLSHVAGGDAALSEMARLRSVWPLLGEALTAAADGAGGAALRAAALSRGVPAPRADAVVLENFEGWDHLARILERSWRVRKADFRYHHLDAGGYYRRLRGGGDVERLVSDEEVLRAAERPPTGTRARARGALVRLAATEGWEASASWDRVRIRDLGRTIRLRDPLDTGRQALASLPRAARARVEEEAVR
ncbi:MAG: proteasome accessory factor PafA2 family protein [Planctomycetales bacterium]|nr:proteasome accessory factor PafA2 family protein [Planctomycetales bacterium]